MLPLLILILTFAGFSHGSVSGLPESLAPLVLEEAVPFVFDPTHFQEEDFQLQWQGSAIEGVSTLIVPDSLEWTRVLEVLTLPRARLRVTADNLRAGQLEHNGFIQPFTIEEGKGFAEIPIALMSGERNLIRVRLQRGNETVEGAWEIQFSPKSDSRRVLFDSSCSSHNLRVENSQLKPNSWALFGCRLVYTQQEGDYVPSLEILAYWDNVKQTIRINDLPTPSASTNLWPLRLASRPGRIRLEAPDAKMELKYSLPPQLNLGRVGVGVGPYHYQFTPTGDTGNNVNTPTGVVTFYGSYFLTEQVRLVSFSAFPLHSRIFVDSGFYLWVEQFKRIDRRVSFNLLLGGHVLVFPYRGLTYVRPTFPQGFELIIQDVPNRRQSLSGGAFILPKISDSYYVNAWLRWSFPSLFVELNYIGWMETVQGNEVKANILGLSLGFGLFSFL